MSEGWTRKRVELLKKLWAEGRAASEVADLLGGTTRNAVLGKIHRLGRASRDKPPPKPRAARPPKPRPFIAPLPEVEMPPLPAERIAIPASQRVTLLSLTASTCRWPCGDPRDADFGFCGAASPIDKPYCEAHARIAYPSGPPRKASREAIAARKAGMWKALARAR